MQRLSIARSTLALCVLVGCAARQPTDGFEEALHEAARSMKDGDAPALLVMLDESQKVGMTAESLAADLQKDHAEFSALADDLESPVSVVFEATVTLDDGEELAFVKEQGVWKLATEVVGNSSPTDPLSVLHAFADHLASLAAALEQSGVLASQHTDGFILVLTTVASELLALRAEDLVLSEDRCYVDLPSGRKVELVREQEGWKVASVFPAIEFR